MSPNASLEAANIMMRCHQGHRQNIFPRVSQTKTLEGDYSSVPTPSKCWKFMHSVTGVTQNLSVIQNLFHCLAVS